MVYKLHTMKNHGVVPKFGKGNCGHCGKPVEDVFHLKHKNLCRDCYNKQNAGYRGTIPGRKRIEIPGNKKNANHIIKNLLKYGIIYPQECQVCGNDIAIAHHPDYRNPLLIEWLCWKHHTCRHYGEKFDIIPVDYSKNPEIIEYFLNRNCFKGLTDIY
jgi:hypothetical protein